MLSSFSKPQRSEVKVGGATLGKSRTLVLNGKNYLLFKHQYLAHSCLVLCVNCIYL